MKKVVVLVCLLSLLVPAAVLVGCGCGSGGSGPGTPKGVAEAFWAAAMKNDVDTTWAMFSKSGQYSLQNKAAWAKVLMTNDPKATVEAGKVTINGDTATVSVKITYGTKDTSTQEVSLVKEGGVWKVQMP